MLKRDRITLHQALRAIEIYYEVPIRFVDVELAESLKIAAELGIYAYDAYLIRCALKYDAPLITLDKSLALLARNSGAKVIEVNT